MPASKRRKTAAADKPKPKLGKVPLATVEQIAATNLFLDHMRLAAQIERDRMLEQARTVDNATVRGMASYWTHAEKAFRWAIAISSQRKAAHA